MVSCVNSAEAVGSSSLRIYPISRLTWWRMRGFTDPYDMLALPVSSQPIPTFVEELRLTGCTRKVVTAAELDLHVASSVSYCIGVIKFGVFGLSRSISMPS